MLKIMDKQLFIGSKKVTEFNEIGDKVQYSLEDATQFTVFKDQFDSMAKEQAYDDGMTNIYKFKPVVKEYVKVFLKYDLNLQEIPYSIHRLNDAVDRMIDGSFAEKYGVQFKDHIKFKDLSDTLINAK
jgi:hypothetical protein